jgi:hypothetical protein
MQQENADEKSEKTPQNTRLQFWKLVAIVFVIHSIPVSLVLWACMIEGEAVMLWFLFFLIDFPLGWLLVPMFALFEYLSIRSAIGIPAPMFLNVVFPAIFFQIIGTINWVIIILSLRWLVWLISNRHCPEKP